MMLKVRKNTVKLLVFINREHTVVYMLMQLTQVNTGKRDTYVFSFDIKVQLLVM